MILKGIFVLHKYFGNIWNIYLFHVVSIFIYLPWGELSWGNPSVDSDWWWIRNICELLVDLSSGVLWGQFRADYKLSCRKINRKTVGRTTEGRISFWTSFYIEIYPPDAE